MWTIRMIYLWLIPLLALILYTGFLMRLVSSQEDELKILRKLFVAKVVKAYEDNQSNT